MLKVRFIYLESVKFILVSYFIHMILNVNGFCDVKKNDHSPNLSLNLFYSNSIFSFFVQKMDPLTLMYKVTKMEHTLATWFINGSKYFRRPPTWIYPFMILREFLAILNQTLENSSTKFRLKNQIQKVFDQKLLLFQPITGQLFEFEFLIWIFIHKYSYLCTYLLTTEILSEAICEFSMSSKVVWLISCQIGYCAMAKSLQK